MSLYPNDWTHRVFSHFLDICIPITILNTKFINFDTKHNHQFQYNHYRQSCFSPPLWTRACASSAPPFDILNANSSFLICILRFWYTISRFRYIIPRFLNGKVIISRHLLPHRWTRGNASSRCGSAWTVKNMDPTQSESNGNENGNENGKIAPEEHDDRSEDGRDEDRSALWPFLMQN